ncbi:PKD domain-containing protein [Candidatus Woesearchaeota archaeon]|nr:PKD domain-containing protein [Candidatus Woesearchaeota archaeon]MBI3027657.1 PKD domain-containing protein [Candidatus Woesearchaeota archaeon]
MHGASENNIVSAQLIHADYSLSAEHPYSEIHYSEWKSLSAIFRDYIGTRNLDIEEARQNIEKIKSKNSGVKSIKLKDSSGKELSEITPNKSISLILNLSAVIVSINNFNALSANWENSGSMEIKTEDHELTSSLEEMGISPKALVSIQGINSFLDNESYYGIVELTMSEPFNSVLYCPDDKILSCKVVQECLHGFEGKECYLGNDKTVKIFVPHFSSIIIALDNAIANLTLNNPDNSSVLQSGENVYLNFTINETVSANYSLDSQSFVNLGNGTSFTALLSGTLPYNVISNGLHTLSIYIKDLIGNSAIANQSFMVNDTAAPYITLNITNNSAFSGTGLLLSINISSNEYANITYRINDANFSQPIDLGASKSRIVNLTPVNGTNNVTINASDMHQNNAATKLGFNFTLTYPRSCSDAAQNGDETGIDCGGSCTACIAFSVSTDKSSYNLTDNAYLTVIARSNSTVNVTVSRENAVAYRYVFVPVFAGAPVAETRIIQNTSNAGNYTINAVMSYLSISEYKNATFEVLAPSSNPISVVINANATTIDESNAVSFSATVTGNSGAISYKWDFQNDGTIDSTDASPSYTYPSNGTFVANLTVSDSKWNQTDVEIITARKLYNITIVVKDNSTASLIESAEVEFDDESKYTDSYGKVIFIKNPDDYNLVVRKSGYMTFSNETEINDNSIFEVLLAQEDSQAPLIQILSPEDKAGISNNSVVIKYKAIDRSSMACTLFTNLNSSLWKIESTNAEVQSDIEYLFAVTNLRNGTYQWKIECIDKNGNSNASNSFTFTVDSSIVENELSVDLNEQDKIAEGLNSEIDSVLSGLEGLKADEKESAEAMQLQKNLEKSKIAVQRANRDLHSLKWRRLNDTELQQETQKILDRIGYIKDTTPKTIEVVDKNEFVKYPNKEDINKALQYLINSTNLKFSKKEISNLANENHKLQSLITVTTKAKIVNVDYISGRKNTITLVQKTVNAQKNLDGMVFFEVVPKEIAKNISEIELLFDYEIIDNDPVVKIDVAKIKEYSYYVNKKLSVTETEKTKSILLNSNLRKSKSDSSLITGFVSLNEFSSDFVKTLDVRLTVEFIAIIVLFMVFLYYQFGESEKFAQLFTGKEIGEIKKLIGSALKDIGNGDYENASSKYKEVNSKFNILDKRKKELVKNSVVELINKINLLYINQLSEKADELVKLNDKSGAYQIYAQIQPLYKIIPKMYKAEIAKRCMELHNAINLR